MKTNKEIKANGWLFVDKPIGMSSNKVLQKIKSLFLNVKLGYVGTLDPMASGFLPIALGKATKVIKYIERVNKEYIFTVEWGVKTETGDIEGKKIGYKEVFPKDNAIKNKISLFRGCLQQKPSKYSAIKVNGERAYKIARNGQEFELPSRKIEVYDLKLIKSLNKSKSLFYVNCSSGTYIRTLAEDLGKSLGTYGHLSSLRRIGFGKLDKKLISLDSLISLMHIDKLIELLKPVDDIFYDVRRINLDKKEARVLMDGKFIDATHTIRKKDSMNKDNNLVIAKYKKQLVVIGSLDGQNFHPETIMNINFNTLCVRS